MVSDKRRFAVGLGLQAGFVIVLITFLSPIFGGQNGLNYLDNLYNSISKGSAYYIPKVTEESNAFQGRSVRLTLAMADRQQAEEVARLLEGGGAESVVRDGQLDVSGDLGRILHRCLVDADAMYYNDGLTVSTAYGYSEKKALYNWWKALREMEKGFKKQNMFRESEVVADVRKKAVETSYNYYNIEPEKITSKLGIVILSLIFYVIYTIWYGFGFMFMFEGWGMRLGR